MNRPCSPWRRSSSTSVSKIVVVPAWPRSLTLPSTTTDDPRRSCRDTCPKRLARAASGAPGGRAPPPCCPRPPPQASQQVALHHAADSTADIELEELRPLRTDDAIGPGD